jgi:hypothetical protein
MFKPAAVSAWTRRAAESVLSGSALARKAIAAV